MMQEPEVNETLAQSMGISNAEWKSILQHLGRAPNYAELSVFSVMWSEHCSYKSSRVHLRRLPSTGPKVVQGPGENAGAVDIGDGYCAVFKMESHNHPSYIEPYQGAATGVGGILRDVFTMGARPVASLNSLRFGRVDHPKTKRLLQGVVAGIGGYGNCIGVPTVGGELQFDGSYDGNILVNAFTMGVAKTRELFFGKATGVGNAVLYIGARTGRDGIHGATMASQEFGDESEQKLPTVQVGDPFLEKLLLEACLEIFASDCIEGIQDMGAAGLTSSSVEMAARAGNGIELDLDCIPRRTASLQPYELLLSESQERMLLVATPGRENEVFRICRKWGIDAAIVGRVTDTGRFVCKATPGYDPFMASFSDARQPSSRATRNPRDPQVVVDIPIAALADAAPKYDKPQSPVESTPINLDGVQFDGRDWGGELVQLLRSPNIGSRRRVWQQYDHIVRVGTVARPGESDAAVVRVFTEGVSEDPDGRDQPPREKFLALSVDGNGRFVALDPYHGAAMAVAECARNVVCSGAEPLGLTDCLNFGSPDNPSTMWQFSNAIDGIRDACLALNTPVVSGNVSLYNETNGSPILPTPIVAIVGQLRDASDRLSIGFRHPGHRVAMLGAEHPDKVDQLAGSEWLVRQTSALTGSVTIDLQLEARLQALVLQLARERRLASAHDISDGGLATCLAECCLANGLGCELRLVTRDTHHPVGAAARAGRDAAMLFAETPTRVIVSFDPSEEQAVRIACEQHRVGFHALGTVGGAVLGIADLIQTPVSELKAAHEAALEPVLSVELR
jgi:phosphoribosylformylglycinamidine (FGAM) synthase-like enzyme